MDRDCKVAAETFKVKLAVKLLATSETVITTEPALLAVITPVDETEAVDELEDAYVIGVMDEPVVPFENVS
jgi:hypothetical protein